MYVWYFKSYWDDQLKTFHDMVEYDGIWIDMNEVRHIFPFI